MKRKLLSLLLGLLLLMLWSSRLLTGEKTFLLRDADTGKVFLKMPVEEGDLLHHLCAFCEQESCHRRVSSAGGRIPVPQNTIHQFWCRHGERYGRGAGINL